MSRRLVVATVTPLLLVAAVGLNACGGDDGSTGEASVTIETFNFAPDPLRVDAGTTVHFENRDAINHSVTAGTRTKPDTATFDHVLDGKGETYDLTLAEPGTYRYFCRFHPGEGMTATIVVS